MTRFKVVLVPFPFDDLSSSKVRPALCLTDPIGEHEHVILAFITSRTPISPLTSDLIVESSRIDFAATGLRVTSTVQLHRLMTATKSFLRRELGTLPVELQNLVKQKLQHLFSINENTGNDAGE